jgi:2-polyprenyl-3-methyl-5-hydroxy-6-metoxy-1,4-benzoquinol methylase
MAFEINLDNVSETIKQAQLNGKCLAWISDRNASPLLLGIAADIPKLNDEFAGNNYSEDFANMLNRQLDSQKLGLFIYSGLTDRISILTLLSNLQQFLANQAVLLVDNADFTGVYDGLREAIMSMPGYRLEKISIDYTDGARAGQGVATLSFDRTSTTLQPDATIPQSKNKQLADRFVASSPIMKIDVARQAVLDALARWIPKSEKAAHDACFALQQEFPDGASPQTYWHEAYQQGFTDFFSWGHDQDFGFGYFRQGTMSTRHIEIVSESIEYGYLPKNLDGLSVLDVGCWTGGDVLALAGLGAKVIAIEEHPVSSVAAKRLCELLHVPAEVLCQSLYTDNPDWQGKFDVVYISGVIYHVTDPVLALRICFSYLKPGGRIVVETKASKLDGPFCEYGGTHEKGWNWYSPTLETLGRWLADAGFEREKIGLHMRPIGRLLAAGIKTGPAVLHEKAGFSRPGSWLESHV